MLYYKALNETGLTPYQKYRWDIVPGEWKTLEGEPALCRNGFHAWITKARAIKEGSIVWEVEFDGKTVGDYEKIAGCTFRFLKKIYEFEPYVVEKGLRNCQSCGKPHDGRIIQKGLAPQWTAPDGHVYDAEPWEDYVARLMPDEKLMGYREARLNLQKNYKGKGSYHPVVPAVHGPFKAWEPDRCGTCGLSEGLHEGWEARKAIADEFNLYDRWELLLVIQQLRGE